MCQTKLTKELFPNAEEILAVIQNAEEKYGFELGDAFSRRSITGEDGWDLLGKVFHFMFEPENKEQPFAPVGGVCKDGSPSSLIPDMITGDQLDALQASFHDVDDPEYQSRIGDVLWLRRKDHNAARVAVKAYLEAGKRIEHPEDWTPGMERYERAARLTRQIEKDGELSKPVLWHIESRVLHYDGSDPSYFTSKALKVLAEFKYGDFEKLAEIAGRVAEDSLKNDNFRRARFYYDAQIKHLNLSKKKEQVEEARIAYARTFVAKAEKCEENNNFMAARFAWENAKCEFNEISSLHEDITEIQRRLSIASEKMQDEMTTIRFEGPDISKQREESRAIVRDLSWEDAFFTLVSFIPLIDPIELRSMAEKQKANPSLSTDMDVHIFDGSRKVAYRPSIHTKNEKDYEKAIEGSMEEIAQFLRQQMFHKYIDPALNQIVSEYNVNEENIRIVIGDSSFIPQKDIKEYCKAFSTGFHGDLSTALRFLIPQTENALRHALRKYGIIPINEKPNKVGGEEVWGLKRILEHPKTTEIFGDKRVFELKSLLIGRFGANMRNELAHGLLSSDDLQNETAFYLFWFLLHLSAYPTAGMRAFIERKKAI